MCGRAMQGVALVLFLIVRGKSAEGGLVIQPSVLDN